MFFLFILKNHPKNLSKPSMTNRPVKNEQSSAKLPLDSRRSLFYDKTFIRCLMASSMLDEQ